MFVGEVEPTGVNQNLYNVGPYSKVNWSVSLLLGVKS